MVRWSAQFIATTGKRPVVTRNGNQGLIVHGWQPHIKKLRPTNGRLSSACVRPDPHCEIVHRPNERPRGESQAERMRDEFRLVG